MKNHELIGALGGIDKAKKVLNDAPKKADSFEIFLGDVFYLNLKLNHWFVEYVGCWDESRTNSDETYSLDSLRTAIAEYTEFKAGDLVVRLDLNSPYIYSIQKIEDGIHTVARKVRSATWGTWLEQHEIRYATASEIAANKRKDLK